ncbi:hypothetical protein OROHE_010383 [Orobanche hederae]
MSGGKVGAGVSEDAGTYNDDAAAMSETDDEEDLRVDDQSLSERDVVLRLGQLDDIPSPFCENTFDNHLSYKLASTEIDHLLKRKWRYTWTMPALNMSSCNWRGTGTFFIKVLLSYVKGDVNVEDIKKQNVVLLDRWAYLQKVSSALALLITIKYLVVVAIFLLFSGSFCLGAGSFKYGGNLLARLVEELNDLLNDLDIDAYYGIKPRLYKHWLESYKASGGSDFHRSTQRSFFCVCNSYHDIMHHDKKPFYLKGLEEDSNIMDAYLMHALNHIFKSRDLIVKNERELAKNQESLEGKTVDEDYYLDRGFTRPKVLIMLPLAGVARRVVKRLIQLTPPKHKANVENLERLYEEFGSRNKDDEGDSEIPKLKNSAKPPDFQALLGKNNDNDHFMIGVKYTNKGIKLYGDFYTSDVIVASPLGLITKIGEAEVEKEKDVDYLSSIEILIIDHADVMLMQNWYHVNTVVEHLNKLPSKQHGTDIMRIRPWYLDGQARFYRQTIVLGSHINPEINALFSQHCLNYRGKIKLECKYKGVLPKILVPVRQIYERFDTESIVDADDARLKYFCEKVFPKIKDSVQHGVMIFISSYFEFVRLRNYLKSQAASFCLFGEYVKRNDISRVRGQFFRGDKKIMLYTESAFLLQIQGIRGVQNLIIYSLPERKEFYPEIVNLLEESDSMNTRVLFSRLDQLKLERIVGSAAAKRMVDSEKGVFVFA